MNYKAVWKPLPGSQSLSLSCPCNEILYEEHADRVKLPRNWRVSVVSSVWAMARSGVA
jgi:hypothetical protein